MQHDAYLGEARENALAVATEFIERKSIVQ